MVFPLLIIRINTYFINKRYIKRCR